MATEKMVSFEELGWNFYYDEQGKYPLDKDELISVSPNEEIYLYYRSRPKQEEDGRFYGNVIESNFNFPMFLFGMYRKENKYNTILLFGDDEDGNMSLNGKVESIAMWNRKLEDATVLDYHTNRIRMIGNDVSYMYSDSQFAEDDGLFAFYEFDESSILTQSFNGNFSSIKSRMFDIGSGKSTNSSVMDRFGDYMFIDAARFYSDFSISARLYVEELKDFTIIKSNETMHVWYDVGTSTFTVELFPHVGNKKILYIQHETMKVHHWYDIAFTYGSGVFDFYIDGELIETHNLDIDIGGVYSLILDHSNIESISIDNFATSTRYSQTTHRDNLWPLVRDYSDRTIGTGTTSFVLNSGGKEFQNMMIGKDRNFRAVPLYSEGSFNLSQTNTIDEILDIYSISYRTDMKVLYSRGRREDYNIAINADNSISFSLKVSDANFYTDYRAATGFTDALVPNGMVKIKIRIKNELVSEEPVFPMLFSVPSIPISVKKIDITDSDFGYLPSISGHGAKNLKVTISYGSYSRYYIKTSSETKASLLKVRESNANSAACLRRNQTAQGRGSSYHYIERVYPENNAPTSNWAPYPVYAVKW